MEQYISKSALLAEIDRIKEIYCYDTKTNASFVAEAVINSINNAIDTLEVKEVDLEKYYHNFLQKEWFDKNCNRTMSEMMAFTAKHFFELGLRAQKGE